MSSYPTTPLTPADPAALAWLEGCWRGLRKGDTVEEHWSAPAAGTLMGMFRWIKGDAVRFFELCTVERAGDGVALHIKHMNPGLASWEAQDAATSFDLVHLSDTEAVFLQRHPEKVQWEIYRRSGDTLTVFFEGPNAPHNPDDEFRYERMKDEA